MSTTVRELACSIGYQVSRQAAAKEAEEMPEPGNPVLAWHHAPQHAAKEKGGEDSQRDRGATAFKISASEQIAQEPKDDAAGANMNCIGTAKEPGSVWLALSNMAEAERKEGSRVATRHCRGGCRGGARMA